MSEKKIFKVMFLCTGNSCRSQMAEGFAREQGKGLIEPHSAGLTPCYVHPLAVAVMKEAGIDISHQKSKAIDERALRQMDLIVTLCGHADKYCPAVPPGINKTHMPVHDPVGTIGPEEEILNAFRRARDDIKAKIHGIIEDIKSRNQ